MKEHCIIDGERCSKCCEVLTIELDKRTRDKMKSARRDFNKSDFKGDNALLIIMEISKRRAKKINKYLVEHVKRDKKQAFFKCKKYKQGVGCTDYDNRPYMCREYPYYGRTKDEFMKANLRPEYRIECTYFT